MVRIKVKKEEFIIGPNDPLPDRLSTEYWETFAKLILEDALPNIFYNLSVDKERPDLRNENLSIGIEVTDRTPQEWQEATNLYIEYSRCANAERQKRALRQIEHLHGKVESEILLCPVQNRDFNQIYDGITDKLKKLNTPNFKIFKNNYLFIFTVDHILEKELPTLSNKINDLLSNTDYHYIFDEIFLYYICGDLFRFNIKEKTAERIKNYYDNWQLGEKARDIIINKYRIIDKTNSEN